jgi:RNA polymerase sigma factor (TIGR02999 family)
MFEGPADVTRRLQAWSSGQEDALNELLPLVYSELRRLARHHLRRNPSEDTLESRALVHEAYLRMVDQDSAQWRDRAHFFGLASNLMRNILVDNYRARRAAKRGGNVVPVGLDEAAAETSVRHGEEIIAIDEALTSLAALDAQQAKIAELRYFGGLSIEETAEVIGVSPTTVKARWHLARAWLRRELSGRREFGQFD